MTNLQYKCERLPEQGMTLLAVMMMLMILSIIGVAAFNVSIMERRLANNYTQMVSSESQAMADIMEAFKQVQTMVKDGDYDPESIDITSITSYIATNSTVYIEALTLQDLHDGSIIPNTTMTSVSTLAGTATTPVYFGYGSDPTITLTNILLWYYTASSSASEFKTEPTFFTTTASKAHTMPVLKLQSRGTKVSQMPLVTAWIALDPGPPVFAAAYAADTIDFGKDTGSGFGSYGNTMIKVSPGSVTHASCGRFLKGNENSIASVSKDCTREYLLSSFASGYADDCPTTTLGSGDFYERAQLQSGPVVIGGSTISPNLNIIDVDSYVNAYNTANTMISPTSTTLLPILLTANVTSGNAGDSAETNYQVFYAPSNISITSQGFGLLFAEGDVHIASDGGSGRWVGLVVAKGDVKIEGDGEISGAVISNGRIDLESGGAEIIANNCAVTWSVGQLPPRILHVSK